jgi:hypothetical protein
MDAFQFIKDVAVDSDELKFSKQSLENLAALQESSATAKTGLRVPSPMKMRERLKCH